MRREDFIDYCRGKPDASADFPFDERTMTIRVGGRIFALVDIEKEPATANLKCDPELSRDLRATYEAVTPGYHMNKEHWNTVLLEADLPDRLIRGLVDRSYELVKAKAKKSGRSETGAEGGTSPPRIT